MRLRECNSTRSRPGLLAAAWLVACLAPAGTAVAQCWWDVNWLERKKLKINNADQTEALVDFPLLVKLDSTRIDYTKTLNAGEDIRFIDNDADGGAELKYEIEKWDEAGTSYVWVKVPQIDGSSKTDHIWLYYDYFVASDNQDPANVWTNGYAGVWHLKEDPTPSAGSWYDPLWAYRKKITIDNTKVAGSTDFTTFPVLISITDTDLRDDAQSDGDDILFTSSNGTTKLDHEIEKFVSGTGVLVAWVEIPTLGATADTDIYMYYGNATVSSQENPGGIWGSDYAAVWHLTENPAGAAPQMLDSTANDNDGTSSGTMTSGDQVSAKIGDGLDLDGDDDYINVPTSTSLDSGLENGEFTASAWVKHDAFYSDADNDDAAIVEIDGNDFMLGLDGGSNNKHRFRLRANSTVTLGGSALSTGVWYYVVGVYDGSAMRLYQDASEVDFGGQSGTVSLDAVACHLGFRTAWSSNIDGIVDEIRLIKVQRSADWITTEFNNQDSPGGFHSVDIEEQKPASGLMADSTANSNTGTSAGSMDAFDQVAGQIDGSLDLDGADDNLRTTLAGDTLTSNLTFSAWFYSDDAGSIVSNSGTQRLVTQERIISGCTRLALALDNDRVSVYRRRTTGGANLHGTTVLTAQVWYHGAMTYDGSTVRVYLNGNEENSVAEADLVGPDPAGIQHGGGCSTRYFDGIIDEVRVASVTRSDDWITAQYKSMTDTFIRWKPKILKWVEVDPYGP